MPQVNETLAYMSWTGLNHSPAIVPVGERAEIYRKRIETGVQ